MKKTYFLLLSCFLCFLLALTNNLYSKNVKAEATHVYEIDSIQVHHLCTTGDIAHLMFSTLDGKALTGYTSYTEETAETIAFEEYVTIKGKKMSEHDGMKIIGMDIDNALSFRSLGLEGGESFTIAKDAVFENGDYKLIFMREFTIKFTGTSYTVTRSARELNFDDYKDYKLPEKTLCDFTRGSAIRLAGQNFLDAAVNDQGGNWGQTSTCEGEFVSKEDAPEGATSGCYKGSWKKVEGTLIWPAFMFKFRDDIEFEADDLIVFKIYFSETIDPAFGFFITNSLTPKWWDAQNLFSGLTFQMGAWNEIKVPVSDYLDDNGNIGPICLTMNYDQSYKPPGCTIQPGEVYFDEATFVKETRVLSDDYEISDISEVVNISDPITFTGDYASDEQFDYSVDSNIGFIRTDKLVEGIKTKVTINSDDYFSFYFILNGNSVYHQNGGAYYWFSNDSIKVGTAQKVFVNEPLPDSIKLGEPFDLEMQCIPYYVDGLKSGNYIAIYINGEQIGEGGYISSAVTNFGTWFGFYLHDSKSDVSYTLAPIQKAENLPIQISLSTALNSTKVKVGATLGTRVKVQGKFYGSETIEYEVVDGKKYAVIDNEGYIFGAKDGEITIRAKVTNVFGTFYSNEVKVTVGNGSGNTDPVSPTDPVVDPKDNDDDNKDDKKDGCKSSLSIVGLSFVVSLIGTTIIASKKKKENY